MTRLLAKLTDVNRFVDKVFGDKVDWTLLFRAVLIVIAGSFFLVGMCYLFEWITGISKYVPFAVIVLLFLRAIFNPRIIRK